SRAPAEETTPRWQKPARRCAPKRRSSTRRPRTDRGCPRGCHVRTEIESYVSSHTPPHLAAHGSVSRMRDTIAAPRTMTREVARDGCRIATAATGGTAPARAWARGADRRCVAVLAARWHHHGSQQPERPCLAGPRPGDPAARVGERHGPCAARAR